jgi:tetratricopeptide (TPR) repeat protein
MIGVLLSSGFSITSGIAAEAPTDTIDMSVHVGQALTAALDLLDAGKPAEAAAALQRLREQPLNDYEASCILLQAVNIDIRMNNHQAAITNSELLLQTQALSDAERTNATLMLGKLNLQLENWSKGIEALLQANERQPDNQETLYLSGFAYYRLQQPELAVQFLEQARDVNPSQAGEPIYSLLGVLYVNAKNYPKALETYETLTSAVPDSVQIESYQSTLAQLYAQAGDREKAKAALQLLIEKFPGSAKLNDYRQRLALLK